ncbi:MAG: phosphoribosylformylglycinamidine synthase [Oscillospiraceae bacterium]|jgi:phosphoribosylformylglycinamidine synthase|nr:phosphoribosylformylglycinamidine synthase [Oscillospiraceae bacterium]
MNINPNVFRCYTEKKPGFDVPAESLLRDVRENLGLQRVESARIFNRYDIEGISDDIYKSVRTSVLSEPQTDLCYDEELPELDGGHWSLGVEALPGQYDQRADSCAQCVQMLTRSGRPTVRTASVYVFTGALTDGDRARLRDYLINPVEAREASPEKPITLEEEYAEPPPVGAVTGLTDADDDSLRAVLDGYALAMDMDDLRFLRDYFRDSERRDPTVTELRLLDTYWSDHCRHTTFGTVIDSVDIEDADVRRAYERYLDARREVRGSAADKRPVTLMDIATVGAKVLKARGRLEKLDVSDEVNACSVHVDALVDGAREDWLLMFKNETHNHPTEIEPFGGAATCIGGAIRDPLSGRAYVYQAMRVTGAGDPRAGIETTPPGKLPQRKLTVTAARGYSSYGNQIGIATGLVRELYHPGYAAKRMEIGAVVGAARARDVARLAPAPGDKIILIGGRTGRDGIGGATGSSKTHNADTASRMGSEVQKGNAPEERKLQRLFLDPETTRMIKRCNDFGAGGVSVAIGELADGLDIDLSRIRKKYEGLDGTELAISESQERMAAVVSPEDVGRFLEKAAGENLEAYVVAEVTNTRRVVMRWRGDVIADISRDFLSSAGAEKHTRARVPERRQYERRTADGRSLRERLLSLVGDLRRCSQRGLVSMFDGSVGAGAVLAPLGGRTRETQPQVMASLLPLRHGETETCSVMAFAFDPYESERDPYRAARDAVVTSVAKLVAAGCSPDEAYLSFQEYFERLRSDPERWGKPLAALLGALDAQLELSVAAIGGKDSMSGSFVDMDVPPTLVSFAVAPCDARRVISPEFKAAGHDVVCFMPDGDIPAMWRAVRGYIEDGSVISAWAVTSGGIAEGIFNMALGGNIGFEAAEGLGGMLFDDCPAGAIVAETAGRGLPALRLGVTAPDAAIIADGERVPLAPLRERWRAALEDVFPTSPASVPADRRVYAVSDARRAPARRGRAAPARPLAVITAFPGANGEIDAARAVERAGGQAEIVVVRNLTRDALNESVRAVARAVARCQMLILPGGFSGGDEPDGAAKFIAAFFRNPEVSDAVHMLLRERDGLILGICNGFQALIKLGLIPFGEIRRPDAASPTLTHNAIGRHQAGYVYTRVASVNSPWMSLCSVGDVYAVPISHGEGRFVVSEELFERLRAGGQLASQYSDIDGNVSMDIDINPNGSYMAVEGLYSPDGRVFGKMGHIERRGEYVGKNIHGDKHHPVFESGVRYFK